MIFRRFDNNGDKRLCREDLCIGLRESGIELTDMEFDRVFQYFDRNGDGTVNFDEFIRGIRGDLNPFRRNLVQQAFRKLDKTGDGCVDLRDLTGSYDVSKNPKVISGEMTREQALLEFMAQWDTCQKDNKVTKEEFENYYADVSSNVDRDDYFELMIR